MIISYALRAFGDGLGNMTSKRRPHRGRHPLQNTPASAKRGLRGSAYPARRTQPCSSPGCSEREAERFPISRKRPGEDARGSLKRPLQAAPQWRPCASTFRIGYNGSRSTMSGRLRADQGTAKVTAGPGDGRRGVPSHAAPRLTGPAGQPYLWPAPTVRTASWHIIRRVLSSVLAKDGRGCRSLLAAPMVARAGDGLRRALARRPTPGPLPYNHCSLK